jgi:hypothetical protein
MAELTHLPPGGLSLSNGISGHPAPAAEWLRATFRAGGRLGGTADPVREIVRGGLGDAIRLAQDRAYRCSLDIISVVGAPKDHN